MEALAVANREQEERLRVQLREKEEKQAKLALAQQQQDQLAERKRQLELKKTGKAVANHPMSTSSSESTTVSSSGSQPTISNESSTRYLQDYSKTVDTIPTGNLRGVSLAAPSIAILQPPVAVTRSLSPTRAAPTAITNHTEG